MVKVSCSICLSSWLDPPDLCSLSCGHIFCRSCIDRYLNTSDEREVAASCPSCRLPIGDDIRPVFLTFDASTDQSLEESSLHSGLSKRLKQIKRGLGKIKAGVPKESLLTAGDMIGELLDALFDAKEKDIQEQLAFTVVNFIKTEIASAFGLFKERKDDHESLRVICSRLEADRSHLLDHNNRLKDKSTADSHLIRELRAEIATLEEQLTRTSTLAREKEDLEQQNTDLDARNKNLWNEYCDLRKRLDAKSKKYKQEIKNLEKELRRRSPPVPAQSDGSLHVCSESGRTTNIDLWAGNGSRGVKRRTEYIDVDSSDELSTSRDFGYSHLSSSPSPVTNRHDPRKIPRRTEPAPTAPRGPVFASDWGMDGENPAARLRKIIRTSSSNSLPFPGLNADGRPGPKAAFVLGNRRRMSPGGKV